MSTHRILLKRSVSKVSFLIDCPRENDPLAT